MQRYFLYQIHTCTFDKCPYSFDELLLSAFTFDDVACKCVRAHKISQFLTVCVENRMSVTLPEHFSLVYEAYLVSDFKNGVHVVRIDDSCHVELLGQVAAEAF